MAIYHNHAKVITKASGRSPVAASAYISGEKLISEYDGKIHDYSKKQGVVYKDVMLCDNAPMEYMNRERLWNAVAQFEGQTGQKARTFEFALPIELNRKEQIQLVQNYVRDNFIKKGMCADIAIHDKRDGNPHAHINLTIRPIDDSGNWESKTTTYYVCKNRQGKEQTLTAEEWQRSKNEWEKKFPYYKDGKKGKSNLLYLTKHEAESMPEYKNYQRIAGAKKPEQYSQYTNPKIIEWSSKEYLDKCREDLATKINREIEKKGMSQRVDHRSHEARGIIQFPTRHLGVTAKALERKGECSDRGNENRRVEQTNHELASLQNQRMATIIHIEELQRQQEQRTDAPNGVAPILPSSTEDTMRERVPATTTTEFDIAAVAHRLEAHRAEFINATMQTEEQTRRGAYKENTVFRTKASQIQDCVRTIKEQTASIDMLINERKRLGLLDFKKKSVLEDKITNFERSRRAQQEQLKKLGVSDPSQADRAIKDNLLLAERERAKTQAARDNQNASNNAAEAKSAFLDLARRIPSNHRKETLDEMERIRLKGGAGTLAYYKATITAMNELDSALKPQQTQEQNHTREKWHDRER